MINILSIVAGMLCFVATGAYSSPSEGDALGKAMPAAASLVLEARLTGASSDYCVAQAGQAEEGAPKFWFDIDCGDVDVISLKSIDSVDSTAGISEYMEKKGFILAGSFQPDRTRLLLFKQK